MRKLVLLLFAVAVFTNAHAALDTVIVTSHQNVVIKTNPSIGETFYPKWAEFPTGSDQYRKVLMQLKFECAPGFKCGEYDYINNISIGRKGGVGSASLGYEIARLMTPQGGYWGATSGWNHTWYYDVTDFAYLLHDSVEIIYRHTGLEDSSDRGWKINLKFICVKGTPVAEPLAVTRLWSGNFEMGNVINPIEGNLIPVSNTLNGQASFVRFKGIHSAHGSDNNGCMEYCRKYRQLVWDGNMINQKNIWRPDCGLNAVYPQSGSWLYDRAGWCPGSPVRYDDYNINGTGGGGTHTIEMKMQQYTANNDFGTINTTAYLIQYKGASNAIDAAIENIIAPNNEREFNRYNPICNDPIVVIRNNGSSPLTSATIEYGVSGGGMTTYQWTGNLNLMEMDTVTLTNPVPWNQSSGKFVANIKNPNGQQDQFNDDNSMTTDFTAPSIYPNKIVVYFLSNKDAKENYYKLVNATTHQTVAFKKNFINETLYQDTINISPNNCYYFYFSDEDSTLSSTKYNKDGLYFPPFNSIEGTGTLKIKNGNTGSTLIDVTNPVSGPFSTNGGDYGTRYAVYFTSMFKLGTTQIEKAKSDIDIFPNPTADVFHVSYYTNGTNAKIYVSDIQGKVVYQQALLKASGTEAINTSSLSPGVYILKFVAGDETIIRKVVKK